MAERCDRREMCGGRCELDTGHDGPHYRAWPGREGGFSWTDEQLDAAVRRHQSRFD